MLGTPLALWHDGVAWRAVADDCPHRRAPLSQGRIEPAGASTPPALVCSYHGWSFGGDGKPVSIPQATHDGGAVEKAAFGSPRACAKAYPTREADGLLWVWGDPASPAEAAAAPTPGNAALRALPAEAVTATTNQWFVRDFNVPHGELVGNLLSQDHVPFAHSGVASSRHSPFAAHFEVSALNAARDASGSPDGLTFDLEWAPDARALVKQHVTCVPPAYIEYLTPSGVREDGAPEEGAGLKNVLFFYATPLTPTTTRVINHAVITAPMSRWVSALLAARPRWLDHLLLNEVFDGDLAFLATTATNTKKGGDHSGSDWAKACYLPTGADAPFRAWNQWLHSRGGGGWAKSLTGEAPGTPPPTAYLPRRVMLDRFDSHTRHCPSCSKALKGLKTWGRVSQIAAGAAFLAAVVAAGSAAADDGSVIASLAAAAPGIAAAAGLLAASAGMKAGEARFVYKDYEHWKS